MLKPLSNLVLIEPLDNATTTNSGLYIPNTESELCRGKVKQVGPGAVTMSGDTIAMSVYKNDLVVYKKRAGTEIRHNGKSMVLTHETDILAVEVD